MKSYEGLYRQGHEIMKASLKAALLQKKRHGARLEVVSWRSRWSAAHGLRSKRKQATGTFQVSFNRTWTFQKKPWKLDER